MATQSPGKTVFILQFHNLHQYFPCSVFRVSGPGEKVATGEWKEASPVPFVLELAFYEGWGDNKPTCLCASVSVAARKFKGTWATLILYPLDGAPADQYF